MTHYIIRKQSLNGTIIVPSSKSQTLRSILFGSLGNGTTRIHHYLDSTDTQSMIHACRCLGAKFIISPTTIEINGLNGRIPYAHDVINAGNSGIVLRFCAALGALSKHPVVITGDHSICYRRPMQQLLAGLTQLGVSAASMRGDGFAPVIIQGPIKGKKAVISGEDSQPVSALLIAAAFAEGPIELEVKNPGEKPWVGLTLDWFDRLGIKYENTDFHHYRVFGGSRFAGFDYDVPGDFSTAAFPIAAALVTKSDLTVKNIDMHDPQGDKELISVFQKMGASIEIDEKTKVLQVKKGGTLSGVTVDINQFIDALPILAVVACFAEGETRITNGAVAKQKECNRIRCVAAELRKMGANIQETEDGLMIRGSSLIGTAVESHQDHRMAMSLAVAALGAMGTTKINDVECISKTFPSFVHDFNALGANIEERG